MKKSELIKIIELVVRKEVKKQVKQILITERVTEKPATLKSAISPKPKPKSKPKVQQHYTDNVELNKVLNETVGLNDKSQDQEEWPTMGGGTFDSSRATELLGYGDSIAAQGGNNEMKRNMAVAQTLREKNVSINDVPESLVNALSRDYSDLMKHDKMKSKK